MSDIFRKAPLTPLLKWPGGKRSIASKIASHIGEITGRYFEPFVGGGALFFYLQPTTAILGDLNVELIECYRQVAQSPGRLAAGLARMKNTEEEYYRIRAWLPKSASGRAARLIYLSTLAFNGIYRQNLRGKHNVPYGKKTHLCLPDVSVLRRYSEFFSGCEFRADDFEKTCADAERGDTVYLDPPYTVAHDNNGFVKYNDRIFSWQDQIRLSEFARKLRKRGCKVVVSNAHHFSVKALYNDFEEFEISRSSVIAASSAHRRTVVESLFVG